MRYSRLAALAILFASTASVGQNSQGGPSVATATTEGAFARAAAENSLSEVLLATVALQKTADKRVQDDAWTMLDHHSRAMGDLAESLSDGAAALPTEPRADQKAALRRMRDMTAAQFDGAYFAHQLDAHARAIALYEQGSRLPDQKVAQYARVTLPVLRAHRDIAQVRQAQPAMPLSGQ